MHIAHGRLSGQAGFGGGGTAATDTGATGTAPTDGFDPTLLKDSGFFKQFGGGGGTAADGPLAAHLHHHAAYGEPNNRW